MTGKELFNKYLAKRDEYASTLLTISQSIGDDIYPLLEKAEAENKKLSIKEQPEFMDDVLTDDILFV